MSATKTRRRPGAERVLATASRLFYTEGIGAVGVDKIVAEADVSKATLYANFRTKDELVVAYLKGRHAEWQAHVAQELPYRESTAEGQILAVYDLLGEEFTDDYRGCPFINAEAELGSNCPTHDANIAYRLWVQGLFSDLASSAGLSEPEALGLQLAMLYDAAMVGAQAQPGGRWAADARSMAEIILERRLGRPVRADTE